MMKLKMKDIVSNVSALKNLLNTKLPIKISYQLNRLAREVDNELAIFEKKRIEIVKELGTPNTETGETSVNPENVTKFTEEYEKLTDVDVELTFANKIKIEDLGDIQIEPSNLISWLFE